MGEEVKAEATVDLVNRDPNELNAHIKVAFDDVLGEPEHAHAMDCVWTNSYKCFTCGKDCCYKVLTLLTGICIALGWGCSFAVLAYSNIWCVTPCLKCYKIVLGAFKECYESCLECYYGTYAAACGNFFSRIKVQQG